MGSAESFRMITWDALEQSSGREEWDRLLLESRDYNVFQSYGWGEYRRAFGWTPARFVAKDESGATVAMAQVLTKRFPAGLTVGWSPGGPVVMFPKTQRRDLAEIIELLLQRIEAQNRRVCIRFNCYLPHSAALTYAFSRSCVRPLLSLTTGYSLRLDLQDSFETLIERVKPRHKTYIRRASAHNIECKAGRDEKFIREFVGLHNELTTRKRLSKHRTNFDEVAALCRQLGEQATIFTGYLEGEALSSYLILNCGQKAFYLMAATGSRGREIRASYAVFTRLLEYLQQNGIRQFDLGGMDPRTREAEGVNRFKRGFGGRLIEYAGEWEWANKEWIRWATNFAIWYRGKRL